MTTSTRLLQKASGIIYNRSRKWNVNLNKDKSEHINLPTKD